MTGEAVSKVGLLPVEPLCVSRSEAAVLIGISPTTFDLAVARGDLPAPICFGRRKVWYIRALRLALDNKAGLASASGSRSPWLDD